MIDGDFLALEATRFDVMASGTSSESHRSESPLVS